MKLAVPHVLILLLGLAFQGAAQTDTSFHKFRQGFQKRSLVDAPGSQYPRIGDYIEFHIYSHVGDSAIFDSRAMNGDEPVPFQLSKPAFRGDLTEGLMTMTAGDSAHFLISVDKLLAAGNQMLPWLEKGRGQMVTYEIGVVKVLTPAQLKAEQKAHRVRQLRIDDSLMRAYFRNHGTEGVKKTASGLYYKIHVRGSGARPAAGDSVTIAYTGRTTDERKFDSNTDSAFSHPVPFGFRLNRKQVIRGWDEGIALLPKGTKATLYIPSVYAYGSQSPGPAIPPNAILIFEVEVLDIYPLKRIQSKHK